ncbi:hypothetical protein AVEN_80373-1 [Araneus ventricosus]|uniref:Tc1-like transposase DDE domain-containing protein n=1 Tax=Araneus ventricosus TaxID=182803 RepID=A0A4Y2TG04_ARAVE|nr:hypothetical protein AVEN_80373-1 [Araneus ventricosus]
MSKYRVIIIKVALSKGCKKRTTGQNNLKFHLSIREAIGICFAEEKELVQKLTDRWRCTHDKMLINDCIKRYAISCSNGSGQCMAMEHFVERRIHFHLQGSVNTQNCRIWARENTSQMQPLPLHYQKGTVWCGFTAAFIIGSFFFEEIGNSGPVTCAVNGTRYESLWRNQLIPALQQRGCVDSTILIQDVAPPHIAT